MIRVLILVITSLFIFSSCSIEKGVKEKTALFIPKKDIEKPAEKKGTLIPEKPLAKIKHREVIPPEEEVRKPGEKRPTVQPGIPGERVKGVAGTISPGKGTGELAVGAAVLDEESEDDLSEFSEDEEDFENFRAVFSEEKQPLEVVVNDKI